MPLSIRSFGDYKPPLYTYLTIPSLAIFGLNEFSVRFISALFGSLSVVIGYFLIKELFPKRSSKFFLLFSLFFSISPWHIQFSRVAFEANLALFFLILGIWLFLKGTSSGKYLILSFIAFAASCYGYHSPRLIIPILVLGMFLIYRKELRHKLIWLIGSVIIFSFLVLPIVNQMKSSTAARLSSVTVINPDERLSSSIELIEYDQSRSDILGKLMHNRRVVFAKEILAGYLDHFNFDFLFLTGDSPGRHHAAGVGMLYLWDLPFILIGIFYLLKERNKNVYLLILWFLTAPVASSLTTGTPHAVRALFYLPTYQIFAAVGVINVIDYVKSLNLNKVIVFFLIFLFFILNFFYYLHMYYVHTPIEYSQWWQYGYKQVVAEVDKIRGNFDKIIITYRYDQPYIFFLFYDKIDPSWYQKNWGAGEIRRAERNFGKYEFRNINWETDSRLNNVLIVGTPAEIPEGSGYLIKEIHFLDGSPAFRIIAR
jgi:4-amino-4-deoxy-L-arabinose transferase-like glycosyltransferase